MWSGPTYSPLWSCPGNTLPKDTWLFDPATAKWSYGNQTRMTQPTGEAKCGAYCSFDSLYYAYSNDVFYSYNASLDKWSQVSLTGSYKPSGYDGSLIPSRKRAQFFMVNPKTVNNVSTHAVSVYDVASRSWSEQAVLPVGSMVYSGYDEVWDDLLIPNEGGSKFVVFHAKDSSVELITTKGVLPSMAGDRCYGRFFYDSADSVFLYIAVVNYKTRVYAYRYRRGAPVADVTPPTTPQNVNATALSDTVVQISWNLSTDPENPVTRYIVFSDGKEVGRTDTLTYRDSALTELTRYLYTVAAVNAVQMKSSQSTPAAVTTSANTIPPSLVTLSPLIARCSTIVLTFTEPLDSASAVNTTHYSLDNNGIVRGAALSADGKTVTLTSAPLSFTASYTITLNGITDRAKTPNAIAAGTKLLFTVPNAQLVVDYGASAAANRFGMAGWTRVIMDAYVGYMS
ncbi:MAG: hypothetical protein JNL74_11840, partial [Fibrobacteres bacterium]|nr:hypothetical protein [Fibrobacterota bacterium]